MSILGTLIGPVIGSVSSLITNWVSWKNSEKDREFQRFKLAQEQKLQLELARSNKVDGNNPTALVQYGFEQKAKLQRELARAEREWQHQIVLVQQEHALSAEERRMRFDAFCIEQEQKIQRELAIYSRETLLLTFDREEELQRWLFEQEKALQQDLAIYRARSQMEIAAYQRQTALASEEFKRILDDHPLKISPSELLNDYMRYQTTGRMLPLLVLISPPTVEFDPHQKNSEKLPSFEKRLTQGLREFLQHYDEPQKLIDFRGGAWNTKRISGETADRKLFAILNSIPTLFLESEIDEAYLHLRIAFWGSGDQGIQQKIVISRFPFLDILDEYAREDALAWQISREKLLQKNATSDDLLKTNRIAELNQDKLRLEEKNRLADVSSIIRYEYDEKHYHKLMDLWLGYHCLITGLIADIHYFTTLRLSPLLPRLLPKIIDKFPNTDFIQAIIEEYPKIYSVLETDLSHWMPDIYAELAESLVSLSAQPWNRQKIERLLEESLNYWFNLRHAERKGRPETHFATLIEYATLRNDKGYLRTLHRCYTALGEEKKISQLERILHRWDGQIVEGKITEDDKGATLINAWG